MKTLDKGSLRVVILILVAIGVHVTFCLSLHYKFLNPLFYITMHAKGQGGCFFGIYQAGVNLLNGESIYGCETYRTPKEIAVPFYHFYRYLPFTSYVASIFAKVLKPWSAYWFWIVINEILLVACILLTVRLRSRFGSSAIIAASFWLLFSPIYTELYMGQFCFLMTFFIFMLLYPYMLGRMLLASNNPGTGNPGGSGNPQSNPPDHPNPGPPGGSNPGTDPSNPPASPESAQGPNPGTSTNTTRNISINPDARADHGNRRTTAPGPLPPLNYDKRRSAGVLRAWISSVSWVLSVLIKSFTALYTLTLFRTGRKKLAISGIAAAIITSVPYFIKHPQDLRWFLRLNFQPLPSYSVGGCLGLSSLLRDVSDRCLTTISTQGIDLSFFDISLRNIPLVIALAAIFITTFLITVRKRTIDPLSNITLWTLTFFLVFKDIWEYHYVMLLPLFVGFYLQTRSKYLLVLFVLLAMPTPFFLYDVPTSENPQAFWSTPLSIMHHSFKAVPTFLFYLWVVRREFHEMGGIRRLLAFSRAR
jgi:hypothetical protein